MTSNYETIINGVIIDEDTTFTITEICQKCNLPHSFLVQMFEHGIFDTKFSLKDDASLDLISIRRIESAFHLYQDLDINPPGIALILELKDELDKLSNELHLLQKNNELPKIT